MEVNFTEFDGTKPSQVDEYFELLTSPPKPDEVDSDVEGTSESPQYEFWVREFLEEYADAFGFQIETDLDEEHPYSERGDFKVRYNGENRILEVEKDVNDFFKHGHDYSESVGWNDIADIDVVFAITDRSDRADELPIPVIVEKESEVECESFGSWYSKVQRRDYIFNEVPEKFVRVVAQYVANILIGKDLPSYSEMRSVVDEKDISEAVSNRDTAYTLVWEIALAQLPSPSNTSEVIDLVESSESVEEVVDSVCSTLVSKLREESESSRFKCECTDDSEVVELVTADRPVPPNELIRDEDTHMGEKGFGDMTEGQWADQLASQMSGGKTEGVKDEITVVLCLDCFTGTYFTRRVFR